MRILVISDIHANLTALQAVLSHAGEVDRVWCLGDVVGYGPDPNECIDAVRNLPGLVCILGNHDAAVLGMIDVDTFNPEARQAVEWTRQVLTEGSLSFLGSLRDSLNEEHVTLAHGSPRHPVWEYLLDTRTASQNFSHFDTDYCFVGHTHLPVIYYLPDDDTNARLLIPDTDTTLLLSPRAILNPGSVGQPRDRDPRAAYAIYDPQEGTWDYRRVAYDVPAVQSRMEAFHLPERHIQRLAAGW